MKMILTIQRFVRDPLGTLLEFAQDIFEPFSQVFGWYPQLAKEVVRLANNLSKDISHT